MVGCWAVGCSRRSEPGLMMASFPKDPNRRAVWIKQVRRADSQPTASSRLCEYHFEKDQFEKVRVDGTRKLKNTAVPTIFAHTPARKRRKTQKVKQVTSQSGYYTSREFDHNYSCSKEDSSTCSKSSDRKDGKRHAGAHFEDNQYEHHGRDGLKKLRDDAIPTKLNYGEPHKSKQPMPPVLPESPETTDSASDHAYLSAVETGEDNKTARSNSNATNSVQGGPHFLTTAQSTGSGKNTVLIVTNTQPNPFVSLLRTPSAAPGVLRNIQPKKRTQNFPQADGHPSKQKFLFVPVKEQPQTVVRPTPCNHDQEMLDLQHKIDELTQKFQTQQRAFLRAKQKLARQQEILSPLFNEDQLAALTRKSSRGLKWSAETIEHGMDLRQVCGSRGYDMLLTFGYPLPSVKTLERYASDKGGQTALAEHKGKQSALTEHKGEQSTLTEHEGEQSTLTEHEGEQSTLTEQEGEQSTSTESGDELMTLKEEEGGVVILDMECLEGEQTVLTEQEVEISTHYMDGQITALAE